MFGEGRALGLPTKTRPTGHDPAGNGPNGGTSTPKPVGKGRMGSRTALEWALVDHGDVQWRPVSEARVQRGTLHKHIPTLVGSPCPIVRKRLQQNTGTLPDAEEWVAVSKVVLVFRPEMVLRLQS